MINVTCIPFEQVEDATEAEKKRLEQEKNLAIESMQAKHKLELDKVKDDLDRKHREKVLEIKDSLGDSHDQVCFYTTESYAPHFSFNMVQ